MQAKIHGFNTKKGRCVCVHYRTQAFETKLTNEKKEDETSDHTQRLTRGADGDALRKTHGRAPTSTHRTGL